MGSCRVLTVVTFCEAVLPVFSFFLVWASDAELTSTVCVAELVSGLSEPGLGSWTWRSCCGSGAGSAAGWELGKEGWLGNG